MSKSLSFVVLVVEKPQGISVHTYTGSTSSWISTSRVRDHQGRAMSPYVLSLTSEHGLLDFWKHNAFF